MSEIYGTVVRDEETNTMHVVFYEQGSLARPTMMISFADMERIFSNWIAATMEADNYPSLVAGFTMVGDLMTGGGAAELRIGNRGMFYIGDAFEVWEAPTPGSMKVQVYRGENILEALEELRGGNDSSTAE